MRNIYTLLFFIISIQLLAQDTYLQCGKLINTKTGEVITEKTIVISGKKIVKIENGYINGKKGDVVIDLKNKTVMPGLIDMHIHIESETNPKAYLKRYTDNEADLAFDAVGFAKKTLMAGFTTVRDLGGSGVNISIKKAIAQGKIEGPGFSLLEKYYLLREVMEILPTEAKDHW